MDVGRYKHNHEGFLKKITYQMSINRGGKRPQLKVPIDETRPRGHRFHTVSCQKLSLIYQIGELRVN